MENLDKIAKDWVEENYPRYNLKLALEEIYKDGYKDGHKRALDTSEVTRVEVVHADKGRLFVKHNYSNVELSMQDDNRTLKIFVKE